MDFAAAAEANDFLLSEVLAQAELDGDEYSELEVALLRWPRPTMTIEEEEAMGDSHEESVPADFSYLPLIRKAATHLRRAYAAATNNDPSAGLRFENAYAALRGAAVPFAGFTHRDAPILAVVTALGLGSTYELVSALVGGFIAPYSLSRPYPSRVVTIVVLTGITAGLIVGALLSWRR